MAVAPIRVRALPSAGIAITLLHSRPVQVTRTSADAVTVRLLPGRAGPTGAPGPGSNWQSTKW